MVWLDCLLSYSVVPIASSMGVCRMLSPHVIQGIFPRASPVYIVNLAFFTEITALIFILAYSSYPLFLRYCFGLSANVGLEVPCWRLAPRLS